MNYTINACRLSGKVKAIPSKSHLHRQLIAAALYGTDTEIRAGAAASEDIAATENCLTALGARILRSEADRIHVKAIRERRREKGVRRLFCKESGSTLRFLLPVVCALGLPAEFYPEGRLPDRPLSPLREELIRHGCRISEPGSVPLCVGGALSGGVFEIAGGVSSQYISGILLTLPLLEAESTLRITGTLESRPYVEMTLEVLAGFGISFTQDSSFSAFIKPRGVHRAQTVRCLQTEGDWSNAAFWLTAGAIGAEEVCVSGLSLTSKQGDKAILQLLKQFGASVKAAEAENGLSAVTVSPSPLKGIEINAADIPDLVPILSLAAAAAEGTTVIRGAARLRLKESDRLQAVTDLLGTLGADIRQTDDGLIINGTWKNGKASLQGGTVSSCHDHRIAMTAAIAAAISDGPVTILGAEAVNKSYPTFWQDFEKLNGK